MRGVLFLRATLCKRNCQIY